MKLIAYYWVINKLSLFFFTFKIKAFTLRYDNRKLKPTDFITQPPKHRGFMVKVTYDHPRFYEKISPDWLISSPRHYQKYFIWESSAKKEWSRYTRTWFYWDFSRLLGLYLNLISLWWSSAVHRSVENIFFKRNSFFLVP